ncbi:competence type IV pilus minor pilin ComGE [Niallia oryzisoli]|uniref:competence type IV pilus minor pilin ComGE n=1 Tax=Niallia oryzisoli TaxID=1737571 RepID=UPI003734E12E
MLKNKGFYMAELIISLSGWLVISTTFVPVFIKLHHQLIQQEEKSEALHLFYEYLQTVIVEGQDRENIVITKEDKQYSIIWEGENLREVKICYEDVLGNKVEIHETAP